MLEWHFWVQRVLLYEPVIKYRDFFTYYANIWPKTCRGACSLGSCGWCYSHYYQRILFLSFIQFMQCVRDRAVAACRSRVWRVMGSILTGSPNLFCFNFFFHRNLITFYTFTCFFNFQGGPQPNSQEFSWWDFIS